MNILFLKRLTYVVFVLISACQATEKAPDLPISAERLVPVLTDLYLAEAAMNTLVGEVKDSMAAVYYQQVCAIHGVMRVDIDSTLQLMQQHPDFMDSTYTKVMERLAEMEAGKIGQVVEPSVESFDKGKEAKILVDEPGG